MGLPLIVRSSATAVVGIIGVGRAWVDGVMRAGMAGEMTDRASGWGGGNVVVGCMLLFSESRGQGHVY